MNESSNPQVRELAQETNAKPLVRLAVFEQVGADKIPLAIIATSKNEDGTWRLEAGGPSDSSVEKLRPLLEGFVVARKGLTVPPENTPVEALSEILRAGGLIVEELVGGDHQLNFQINLNSGLVVGTHSALHPFAEADNALGRRIFDAIARGLSNAVDELADEIEAQLANSNTATAVTAVKRDVDRGLFGLRPTKKLLNSLMRIDVSILDDADKRSIRDCRLHVAQRLNRFEIAGAEANAILTENVEVLVRTALQSCASTPRHSATRPKQSNYREDCWVLRPNSSVRFIWRR
jgi:hypothetical protein